MMNVQEAHSTARVQVKFKTFDHMENIKSCLVYHFKI